LHHVTAELLDADAAEAEALIERTRQQLVLINLGVPAWSSTTDHSTLIDETAREELQD